jgi:cell wall-associated NlpC family hydrolase
MIWTEEKKQLARDRCRYWDGTPHHHWMAVHGVGIDCIHFVVDVLIYAGVIPQTAIPQYHANLGRSGAEQKLIKEFSERAPVDLVGPPYQFGDLLVFNPRIGTNHVALLIDNEVWHSQVRIGVLNHPFVDFKKSILKAMRLTEEDDSWLNQPRFGGGLDVK